MFFYGQISPGKKIGCFPHGSLGHYGHPLVCPGKVDVPDCGAIREKRRMADHFIYITKSDHKAGTGDP